MKTIPDKNILKIRGVQPVSLKNGGRCRQMAQLQLLARTSLDYPETGNQPDSYSQNTLGATLNWTWVDSALPGNTRRGEQESI